MDRRSTLKSLGLISLHSLYPSVLSSFLSSCHSGTADKKGFFFLGSEEQQVMVQLIDIIIPRTKTKSASEVKVQYFIDEVFSVCMDKEQQLEMKGALTSLTKKWKETVDKTRLVKEMDEKAYSNDEAHAWFRTVKQLTMIGYFTSEEGSTKSGDYQKIPDRFVGEQASDENTLAHARTSLRFNL